MRLGDWGIKHSDARQLNAWMHMDAVRDLFFIIRIWLFVVVCHYV